MNLTLGDETRGFLSADRIARMKKGVIYVNTARGALADEAAGGALPSTLRDAKSMTVTDPAPRFVT